jgi:hypothetical protein
MAQAAERRGRMVTAATAQLVIPLQVAVAMPDLAEPEAVRLLGTAPSGTRRTAPAAAAGRAARHAAMEDSTLQEAAAEIATLQAPVAKALSSLHMTHRSWSSSSPPEPATPSRAISAPAILLRSSAVVAVVG